MRRRVTRPEVPGFLAARVVFDRELASSYERGGWTVTERPEGGWSVVNPRLLGPETRAMVERFTKTPAAT